MSFEKQNNSANKLELHLVEYNSFKQLIYKDFDYLEKSTTKSIQDIDQRLFELEKAHLSMHQEATKGEKDKFAFWISLLTGLGVTIIGAVVGFIFSRL